MKHFSHQQQNLNRGVGIFLLMSRLSFGRGLPAFYGVFVYPQFDVTPLLQAFVIFFPVVNPVQGFF
jgi:hypothetical protein